MAEESIFAKLKPPTPEVEENVEDEPIFPGKFIGEDPLPYTVGPTLSNNHGMVLSMLEDVKNVLDLFDESEDATRVLLHVNKATRILRRMEREEKLKNS